MRGCYECERQRDGARRDVVGRPPSVILAATGNKSTMNADTSNLLWFILMALFTGLIVGAIARLLVPGPTPMGLLGTAGAGIVGALGAMLVDASSGAPSTRPAGSHRSWAQWSSSTSSPAAGATTTTIRPACLPPRLRGSGWRMMRADVPPKSMLAVARVTSSRETLPPPRSLSMRTSASSSRPVDLSSCFSCPTFIGSQGRAARHPSTFPHPPFNPCVRFSRTRLSDGLLDMVTQPSGSGWCP